MHVWCLFVLNFSPFGFISFSYLTILLFAYSAIINCQQFHNDYSFYFVSCDIFSVFFLFFFFFIFDYFTLTLSELNDELKPNTTNTERTRWLQMPFFVINFAHTSINNQPNHFTLHTYSTHNHFGAIMLWCLWP